MTSFEKKSWRWSKMQTSSYLCDLANTRVMPSDGDATQCHDVASDRYADSCDSCSLNRTTSNRMSAIEASSGESK